MQFNDHCGSRGQSFLVSTTKASAPLAAAAYKKNGLQGGCRALENGLQGACRALENQVRSTVASGPTSPWTELQGLLPSTLQARPGELRGNGPSRISYASTSRCSPQAIGE